MDNPFDLLGQHIHIAPFQQLFRRWKVGASEKCLPAGGGLFVITFHVRHDRREQTYICYDTYRRLARILPLLSDGMTVPAFLDNVLDHHLEVYEKELDEMLK